MNAYYGKIFPKLFLAFVYGCVIISMQGGSMDWKKEIEFQKGQMIGMLPNREDFFLMGVSALVGGIFLGFYCLLWWASSFF